MIILTFWEDPIKKNTPDDYDELFHVRLKTVHQIPNLVAAKPPACTMISSEHSAFRKLRNGSRTNFFKIVWEKGQPIPPRGKVCPLCMREMT